MTNLLALVTTKLEVHAALEGLLQTVLALSALQTEYDLLGGLGLSIMTMISSVLHGHKKIYEHCVECISSVMNDTLHQGKSNISKAKSLSTL